LSESAGTPFTAEEYLKSVAESSEEMSAEQLHSVAGGVSGEEDVGRIVLGVIEDITGSIDYDIMFPDIWIRDRSGR
jgi:hypothetical protein